MSATPKPSHEYSNKKSLRHHNNFREILTYRESNKNTKRCYGVSPSQKPDNPLSKSLFIKKYDRIRDFLLQLGFTTAQREIILSLLRLSTYYDEVYPKEAQITESSGYSKATFWRTIAKLKEQGLIEVINRFIPREKAQISNLYRLDKLILLIVRWLAEHGVKFTEKWLEAFLKMSGKDFWQKIWSWNFDSQNAFK